MDYRNAMAFAILIGKDPTGKSPDYLAEKFRMAQQGQLILYLDDNNSRPLEEWGRIWEGYFPEGEASAEILDG